MSAADDHSAEREMPFGFWRRSYAMLVKEFIQLRRDRVSFAMIVMIPVMQLLLFGYAINTTPRHLPTAVLMQIDGTLGDTCPLRHVIQTGCCKTTGGEFIEPRRDDRRAPLRRACCAVRGLGRPASLRGCHRTAFGGVRSNGFSTFGFCNFHQTIMTDQSVIIKMKLCISGQSAVIVTYLIESANKFSIN